MRPYGIGCYVKNKTKTVIVIDIVAIMIYDNIRKQQNIICVYPI